MNLVVINQSGTVHRVFASGATCPTASKAERRKQVTPNQCLVYHLACCESCWPRAEEYVRIVQTGQMT